MSSYIVGSFNIQKLNYRSDSEKKKNFEKLAMIIRDENFDIVAIQEAVSQSAIKELTRNLGIGWDYVFPQRGGEYAFIWKKRRLRLSDSKKNNNPQIFTSYHYRKSQGETLLVRPPYVGSFTSEGLYGGCNFELRLINTHIAFSKPAGAPKEIGEWDARRNELSVLSRDIYGTVSDKVTDKVKSIFTILLGDYNLVLGGIGPRIHTAKYPTYQVKNGKTMEFVQSELTTLKRPMEENISNDEEAESLMIYDDSGLDLYSHNYDHFGYDDTHIGKYGIKASRVNALEKYYSNNLREYRKEISDHVPIKLEITLM